MIFGSPHLLQSRAFVGGSFEIEPKRQDGGGRGTATSEIISPGTRERSNQKMHRCRRAPNQQSPFRRRVVDSQDSLVRTEHPLQPCRSGGQRSWKSPKPVLICRAARGPCARLFSCRCRVF